MIWLLFVYRIHYKWINCILPAEITPVRKKGTVANITLLGLEKDLAEQLSNVLRAQHHRVHVTNSIQETPADIVFSTGDTSDYPDVIRRLAGKTPVVVVNRLPENGRWLDALELGAADYCGAPFEPVMMRWLVDSVLRRGLAATPESAAA